jgi:hypothetical protein
MYKCPLNIGQYFNFFLQRLADVVGLPQRRVRIHYDVDLDKIVLKEMSTAHTKKFKLHHEQGRSVEVSQSRQEPN